jgi:hypothetical protein
VRLAKAKVLTVERSGALAAGCVNGEEEGVLVHCAGATLVVLDLAVLDHEAIMPAKLVLGACGVWGRLP